MRSSPTDPLRRIGLAALLALLASVQVAVPAGRSVPVESPRASASVPDSGKRFALLIGVMGYPALRPRDRLTGPGNDIALVADFLDAAPGMAETEVSILLDDGVHPPATLAAIRAEMAALAEAVGPGDFVYIHFSGHGTQAPAEVDDDEPDGLDELFLPYDVGLWNRATGEVENALVDDEIGAMLDAIRAKGADVFAVFDTCNSGTVTRGPDGVQLRRVAPEVLGVPTGPAVATDYPEAPFDGTAPQAQGAVPRGQLTAFFAAQAAQSTPEMNLPRDAPDRKPLGVFTYTVLSELAARPGQTYADLGAAILTRYATDGLAPGTQPLFEGALDEAALRAPIVDVAGVTTWPLTVTGDVARLPAGGLHGLSVGDRLVVRDGPEGSVLGEVMLRDVAPLRSSGTPVDLPFRLPEGAVAVADPASISVRIQLAMPGVDTLPLPTALALFDALAAADPALAGRLDLRPPGMTADLRLVVEGGRIAVVPGGGVGTAFSATGTDFPAASIPLTPDMTVVAREIAPLLLLEARALLLTRAAAALPPSLPGVTTDLFAGPGLVVAAAPLDRAMVPALHPGDVVTLTVSNARDRPVDVDVLYISADRTIQHIRQIRARPGDALSEPLFRVLPEGYGQELILIVQRDVEDGTPRDPLTFLATGAVPSALRTLGDETAPSLSRYLIEAGLASALRSPTVQAPGAAAIAVIPVVTRPD